jgi:hypothetical protein
VGGRIFELSARTWTPVEKSGWLEPDQLSLPAPEQAALIDARRNSPKQPRVWFCETVGSLVVQDGQARPFVYDGAVFRRADDAEVPVGRAMAYANGRLAVAVNSGCDVRLGDIRRPEHQSELRFTEWANLAGGGDFSFPSEVLALQALPVIDTGSGQGALIVGCESSVHSLKTQITQRDLWAEVGFQTLVLPNRGIVGGNAVVAVNQDLYFRSSDGLRSIRTSTADYDAPGLTPLSVEVRHRFDYDTPFLLRDASLAYFDNRILCTHSPFVYSSRALNQGLISLNFDALSGRGQKSAPCFDGEWDGFGTIAQVFAGTMQGVERCFVLGRDLAGANALWEVLPEIAAQEGDEPTQAIETRTMFADSPAVLKNIRRCDLMFSDIRGGLAARVYFRPDKHPAWIAWDAFAIPAPASPQPWGKVRPQRRVPLSTRAVPEGIDPQTGRPVSVAGGFQVRVEWEGFARLDLLTLWHERADFSAFADNADPAAAADVVTLPAGQLDPSFWHTHFVSPHSGIT